MIGWNKEPAAGDTDHLHCLGVALLATPHSHRVKQPTHPYCRCRPQVGTVLYHEFSPLSCASEINCTTNTFVPIIPQTEKSSPVVFHYDVYEH